MRSGTDPWRPMNAETRTPVSTTAQIARRHGAPLAAHEAPRRRVAPPPPRTGCSRPAPRRVPSSQGTQQAPPRRSRPHPWPGRGRAKDAAEIVEEALAVYLGMRALDEAQAGSSLSEEEAAQLAYEELRALREERRGAARSARSST